MKKNVVKLRKTETQTPEEVVKEWRSVLGNFEDAGGVACFAVVAITMSGDTFVQISEGNEYRNMLGALEHLKLKFYTENNA